MDTYLGLSPACELREVSWEASSSHFLDGREGDTCSDIGNKLSSLETASCLHFKCSIAAITNTTTRPCPS